MQLGDVKREVNVSSRDSLASVGVHLLECCSNTDGEIPIVGIQSVAVDPCCVGFNGLVEPVLPAGVDTRADTIHAGLVYHRTVRSEECCVALNNVKFDLVIDVDTHWFARKLAGPQLVVAAL